MDEDYELLKRWAAGDQAAGDTLVQRSFPTVFRFLRNKVDDADLDELAQKTFLGCLESADRFSGRAKFRTYLLTIARNHLVDHIRHRGRMLSVSPEQLSVHRVSRAGLGPESRLALDAQRRILLVALRRLPIEMQLTVELHYWEKMAVAEIATVVGIPEGTVKSRLHRARSLLKQEIAAMDEDAEIRADTASNLDDWAAKLREAVDVPQD